MKNKNKVKQVNVPHDLHDSIWKSLTYFDGQAMLDILGIKHKFARFIKTEQIKGNMRKQIPDIIIQTKENMIVIIEFQSTNPSKEKIQKFFQYRYKTFLENQNQNIELYVVCHEEFEGNTFEVNINKYETTEMNKISVKKIINSDYVLEKINEKIDTNKNITNRNMIELVLCTYGSTKRTTYKVFSQIIATLDKLNRKNKYDIDQIKDMTNKVELISEKLMTSKEQKKLKGELKMTTLIQNLENQLAAQQQNHQKELQQKDNLVRKLTTQQQNHQKELQQKDHDFAKKLKQKNQDFAKKLKQDNINENKIAEYTGLTLEEIRKI